MSYINLIVKKWLKENKKFINHRPVKNEISCPRGIIQEWIKYDFETTERWIGLMHYIQQLRISPYAAPNLICS